ncbi:MAG: PQQ-binding-like beta-propeller repeat protein, partial [bacterium]
MKKDIAAGMMFCGVVLFFCQLVGLSLAKGENNKSFVSKSATENAMRSTHSTGTSLFDSLEVDFGTIPSATVPLDRWLKHRFEVQNISSDTMNIGFSVFCVETDQTLPAWPQPNDLYLEPGEEQIIITFMDELWGKIRDLSVGQHTRTLEYRFSSKSDTSSIMYTQSYLIDVLDPTQVSGSFLVAGVVKGPDNQPLQGMNVSLSTGNGGFGTNENTANDGSFSFNVPQRSDWTLEIRALEYAPVCIYVDSSQHNYDITLESQSLDSTTYVATELVTTNIGFWRGEVSDDEQSVLIVQGMENWSDWSLHDQSKLMMYTIDGQKLWDYNLGQQAWGASLSRDGKYAACVTTGPTGVSSLEPGDISVFEGATGTLLWQKNIETAFGSSVTNNRMGSFEVRISSQNQYLAVGTGPGDLLFLDLLTGQLLWRTFLEGQIRNIQFSADDAYVYAGSGDGRLYKLSTTDGTIIWKTHVWAWPFVSGLQLSPDESTIAVGVKTGEVSLVRTSDGVRLWTYDMKGTAHWLDYSPDGTYLVVGSGGQGGTTLFEVSTGTPLWTFSFFSASGGFTGDGQYILIHDQPPVILGLNGHVVEMLPPLLAGRAQFSYITKDKSRFVAAARDMDPNGTGIVFYEGGIVNYTVAAPSAPVLLSPENGSTVQELSPTLSWRHVNGATSYQLQVASDSAFTNLVFNESSLPDSSKQISNLDAGTEYYWKVKAKNDGGTSPFSEVWQFTTFSAGQP